MRSCLTEEYKVGRLLGVGAYGETRVIKNKVTSELGIAKELNLRTFDESIRTDLRDDISISIGYTSHCLIRYTKVFVDEQEDGVFYLVHDLLAKENLERFMTRYAKKNIPEKTIWTILKAIALALKELHSLQYDDGEYAIHGELKPTNVLIGYDGQVLVTDYGRLRRFKTKILTSTFTTSLPYYAPEVLQFKEQTRESDIWALGAIGYELCTGTKLIKDAYTVGMVANKIRELSNKGIQLALQSSHGRPSKALVTFISSLLVQNPSDRPELDTLLDTPELASASSSIQKMSDLTLKTKPESANLENVTGLIDLNSSNKEQIISTMLQSERPRAPPLKPLSRAASRSNSRPGSIRSKRSLVQSNLISSASRLGTQVGVYSESIGSQDLNWGTPGESVTLEKITERLRQHPAGPLGRRRGASTRSDSHLQDMLGTQSLNCARYENITCETVADHEDSMALTLQLLNAKEKQFGTEENRQSHTFRPSRPASTRVQQFIELMPQELRSTISARTSSRIDQHELEELVKSNRERMSILDSFYKSESGISAFITRQELKESGVEPKENETIISPYRTSIGGDSISSVIEPLTPSKRRSVGHKYEASPATTRSTKFPPDNLIENGSAIIERKGEKNIGLSLKEKPSRLTIRARSKVRRGGHNLLTPHLTLSTSTLPPHSTQSTVSIGPSTPALLNEAPFDPFQTPPPVGSSPRETFSQPYTTSITQSGRVMNSVPSPPTFNPQGHPTHPRESYHGTRTPRTPSFDEKKHT
ncbi:Kinase, NEK [Giardia muris]|uniref:non-specific serine/threonine protein kinase n=1 Tax=Giardia muris TaxID=5742 RepID=A0A4Z1T3J5_GIAMU|nr:Kinase, NEK [Giardia muris]|eukprot:TNJ28543.1 Kinase, NEK [Giardia muris]